MLGKIRVDADVLGLRPAVVDDVLFPREITRRGALCQFALTDLAYDALAFGDQVNDLPIDIGQRIAKIFLI